MEIHDYTYIDETEIWQCNDCGAYADNKEDIVHHKTCELGESKRWEKYYSEDVDD